PALPAGIAADASDSPTWSTEVRIEAQSPQPARPFTLLPSIRLPWQAQKLDKKPEAKPKTYTLQSRLAEISPAASERLARKFEAAKVTWPPAEVALVAIKDEKALELHARSVGGPWKHVHRYRVLAASGDAGPKLYRGDKQVPEGVYRISYLNPNSAYHVSLRVNYPNSFDRSMAAKDGRKDLGGDIMIHGRNSSAGCLAMGDEVAEELFVLAAQTGLPNIRLIITPSDFRRNGLPLSRPGQPQWLPTLYAEVATAMAEFKAPQSPGLLSFFAKWSGNGR
ncbi:MAG: murein L,D-transpeptidase family protein, partial [Hyphomicrobiales bacterium]